MPLTTTIIISMMLHDDDHSDDAKTLTELIRKNPGGVGSTLLHFACNSDSRSAVIPVLLAHPDIDVNAKNEDGSTPFLFACRYGSTSCVREMLKDSRVKVKEPNNDGCTPLWCASYRGHLDGIKWWIASGREIGLGTPGDVDKTDALAGQRRKARQKWWPFWRDSRRIRWPPDISSEWILVSLMNWLPRCLPWWSLSRMDCWKSTTPLHHLRPGSSKSQDDYHLNPRWCCAFARRDHRRRSSQAKTARWPSSPWPRGSCGPHSSPTSHTLTFLFHGAHFYFLLPSLAERRERDVGKKKKKKKNRGKFSSSSSSSSFVLLLLHLP